MPPHASIRFVIDRTYARHLRNDPKFRAGLAEVAESVASAATANGQKVNATYHAEVTTGPEGLPRVVASALPDIRNENFGGVASWIEFGTQSMRKIPAPLRNAVASTGLKLRHGGDE